MKFVEKLRYEVRRCYEAIFLIQACKQNQKVKQRVYHNLNLSELTLCNIRLMTDFNWKWWTSIEKQMNSGI